MAHAHTNRLANETSPYLLQHAHNPVDWYPWGREALDRARAEDKPILLSVGYSACHWCHVMERESFEVEQTAALMNASFVCIKVDREERPDVDQLYQGVVQLMRRGGGWPLTVFLTPSLEPFFGGTYFPPDDRFGLPGFPRLLSIIADGWKSRRHELLESAQEFKRGLSMLMRYGLDAQASAFKEPDIARAGERQAQDVDPHHGGFGGAPKFPNPMSVALLLRAHRRGAGEECLRGALLTLDRMAEGGVYDQLGGGFHRYSVDAHWSVPHFEKMLYDNAQLLHLYAEGFQLAPKPLYRRVVEETVGYLAREMKSPEGAFYSSQDADSEGVEGKFFVFDPKAVAAVVGEQRAVLLCEHLGVDARGKFEHGQTVLHLAQSAEALAARHGRPVAEVEQELAAGKRQLFEARAKRVAPGRDDKVLTGWNGLTIRGLAFAARVFSRPDWAELAKGAADFVLARMRRDGRLLRTYKDGRAHIDALLEDYGDLCEGLVELYAATFDARYLEEAAALADQAVELFWDEQQRAYRANAKDGEQLLTPVFALHDNAWPSGASTLSNALVRLAGLTSRERYLAQADKYLSRLRDELLASPFGYGHALCAADALLDGAATVAVVGERAAADAMRGRVDAAYAPTYAVCWAESEEAAPPILKETFAGKSGSPGVASAYVCRKFSCGVPVTSPSALALP